MAYVHAPQRRLFFDIETQANPENLALMPEPKAAGNLKDPVKIAAAIAEKKQELIDSAALDPDYGKVLSIGVALDPDGPITVRMVGDPIPDPADGPQQYLTEAMLISKFWDVFQDVRGQCVGFNILSFDLPYLMARSMYLGVKVPFTPALAKFRVEPVTDLYAIRYNWGPGKGLKAMVKLLGIQNDLPDVDGSQVKDMTAGELRAYQASDVKLTIEVFKRMNGVYFNL